MGKTSKGGSKSTSHQMFKDKARTRIDDLQGMFKDLQFAMKESRTGDIPVLEERMNQMLREWKAELDEPSPASSQNDGSLGSFSSDLYRFLVDDDATSALTANPNLEPEANSQNNQDRDPCDLHEIQDYFVNQTSASQQEFHDNDQFKGSFGGQHTLINNMEMSAPLDYHHYDLTHDIDHNLLIDIDGTPENGDSFGNQISSLICTIDPPSAFLGPKCALWDCVRPAKGVEGHQEYCDRFHADLAKTEGPPGSTPLMRCGRVDIKDGVLFAALIAKTQGKDVGIPQCEGAATMKSPWNSPELFNLELEGESLREWFFFEKPRKAFEHRSRKQKWSLPDYDGRGWHESRKQIVKEFGGLKRSYYMDPQPLFFEWHLFVYELNNSDTCALYRLELKVLDDKRSPLGKVPDNLPADLGRQNTTDGQSLRAAEMVLLNDAEYIFGGSNQKSPTNESCSYRDYSAAQALQEHGHKVFDQYINTPTGTHDKINNLEVPDQLNCLLDLQQEFGNSGSAGFGSSGQYEDDNKHHTPGSQPSISHQYSAFLWQKCALWDCSRPAQQSNYCSMFHGALALNEGRLSMTPVIRPKGISVKDGTLFASLGARIHDKDVGIPECEGAATMKSPWNSELFDISLFEGETIREWLFFDKPRKAFQSGNRKQRSLPDYKGRGWHASRTQVMKEHGGVKKSYYMDPQPMERAEWHLYEYEVDMSDALTLFRLELKIVDGKKSPRGKVKELHELQNQMGRLTAGLPTDHELSVKHETSDMSYR